MILIVDTFTFNMAIAIVCVIFLVVYTIVYKITSREYYKIVNRKIKFALLTAQCKCDVLGHKVNTLNH